MLRLRPNRPGNIHIVYLHGGAFVYPLQPMHWPIIAALLVKGTGATVTVPSYGLAPESPSTMPLASSTQQAFDLAAQRITTAAQASSPAAA